MKRTIALIYGGRSVEHEISIRSAQNIAQNIDQNIFDVLIIGIDKKGDWFHCQSVIDLPSAGDPILITLKGNESQFVRQSDHQELNFDVVFPIVHGTDGEDGGLQGLFRTLGKPVVGSDVLGSAIAMDKTISKKVLEASGVPVVPYLIFTKEQIHDIRFNQIVQSLGTPFMVKAADLGSSVGIHKVSKESELIPALNDSFKFTDTVLLESFVQCRELECGILGNENPKATFPGEIVLKKKYDFYTYEAKYEDDDAIDIVVPAKISNDIATQIMTHCVAAYKALRCNDFARVDVFLTAKNEVYINEINTLPGFTSVSMFPVLWQNMGLSYPELISQIIRYAVDRSEKSGEKVKSYRDKK